MSTDTLITPLDPVRRRKRPAPEHHTVTFNGFTFIRSKATEEDRAALEKAVRAEFLHWNPTRP